MATFTSALASSSAAMTSTEFAAAALQRSGRPSAPFCWGSPCAPHNSRRALAWPSWAAMHTGEQLFGPDARFASHFACRSSWMASSLFFCTAASRGEMLPTSLSSASPASARDSSRERSLARSPSLTAALSSFSPARLVGLAATACRSAVAAAGAPAAAAGASGRRWRGSESTPSTSEKSSPIGSESFSEGRRQRSRDRIAMASGPWARPAPSGHSC
mmetsp:Transcript_56378/g.167775  ORF Transcript_56378/g.167775 Transcript_56378/m.167775 type:complete len:217 (-) Transcript_56378:8-658(-)